MPRFLGEPADHGLHMPQIHSPKKSNGMEWGLFTHGQQVDFGDMNLVLCQPGQHSQRWMSQPRDVVPMELDPCSASTARAQ